ncbi:hypothetical protein PHYSODRAFT_347643 [Phytophthora sojae]|uniref:Uncharacterized protein n=1 Tax=Phytophthora sojae (strain P6497) TaxID=1094619 RepID=G4ZZ84_PHYSP|nr:hypothetical protein PHYSODRAFT_347643 [Phytophthora sojae]EGZ11106.1 hypothetical protein PHYSODRAFT_347643 [Phytophthora sojae]|eukprot:XP_009533851.1 hypothetical protein PHYSODRAFT_347643 [Phytophthora sojae]
MQALTTDSQHLLAETDVFAEEQQAKQDQLDALLNILAPPLELEARDDNDGDNGAAAFPAEHPAAPADLAALQSFLASDAAQQDKIEQLVNFLADGTAVVATEIHDELAADSPAADVFDDEQTQQEQKLKDLADSLAGNKNGNTATALLATNAGDVDATGTQTSFLSVVGGAVVLLVAVVLAVATRRSRSKHEKTDDENKDFSYSILYE